MIGAILLIFKLLYIGPGMSGGVFAVLIGILTSFLLSLIAIFWYPFKRLFRRIKTWVKN